MNDWSSILKKFIEQAHSGNLKTSFYPKEWSGLKMKVSFGMGGPARVPWIAFIAPEMAVSKGFYPVYLYYKELNTLILAYGVSETEEFSEAWPQEISSSAETITSYFDKNVPRYGDSFVFKSYNVMLNHGNINIFKEKSRELSSEKDLESDLNTILEYYKKIVSVVSTSPVSTQSQGLFYMEKQLEDFIIQNWSNTELGKKYDLIIEEGEMISQQFRTEIGPIDILAKDKTTKSFVVIELKKNQTSDDTIGQLTRYMGWIKNAKKDNKVKGIIIAGQYDKKLEYALKMVPNTEVFLYEVSFILKEFNKI